MEGLDGKDERENWTEKRKDRTGRERKRYIENEKGNAKRKDKMREYSLSIFFYYYY